MEPPTADAGRYERHVFICLNKRPDGHPRGDCTACGSEVLHARLKALIKERGLQKTIRINRAGCLDVCEHGASAVVYPENVWYGDLEAADASRLVEEHLLGGTPLEDKRLTRSQLRPWESESRE